MENLKAEIFFDRFFYGLIDGYTIGQGRRGRLARHQWRAENKNTK